MEGVALGAGRRRGIVGAPTGMRGMSEGAGRAREARVRGSWQDPGLVLGVSLGDEGCY